MSRKLLIVMPVVAVLLATLIAPASTPSTAIALRVDRAASIEAAPRLGPGSSPYVLLPVLQLAGGSECGGGGGCPI
jgi:hypothetical protein